MDVNTIIEIVNGVGFPIACCCYLLWNNEKQRSTFSELSKALSELTKTVELMKNELFDLKGEIRNNGSK